jgi:hypothetical protein
MAQIVRHDDYNREMVVAWVACHWVGPAGEAFINVFHEVFDLTCPRRDTMLLVVPFMIALPKATSQGSNAAGGGALSAFMGISAARAEPDTIASAVANKTNFFMTIPITL